MAYKQSGFTPFTLSPHASPQYRLNAAIKNQEYEYKSCIDRANGVPEAIARCKQSKAKRQASIDRGRDNL